MNYDEQLNTLFEMFLIRKREYNLSDLDTYKMILEYFESPSSKEKRYNGNWSGGTRQNPYSKSEERPKNNSDWQKYDRQYDSNTKSWSDKNTSTRPPVKEYKVEMTDGSYRFFTLVEIARQTGITISEAEKFYNESPWRWRY